MSRLQMGDPGLAPDSMLAYVEDMLMELAQLAEISGEAALASAILRAAKTKPVKASALALPAPLTEMTYRNPDEVT